jgi:hypothetical protein
MNLVHPPPASLSKEFTENFTVRRKTSSEIDRERDNQQSLKRQRLRASPVEVAVAPQSPSSSDDEH